tara:strand:+ start:362 stop:820 length:459 start_codon:yes stop_codon:yes gene_type:complete
METILENIPIIGEIFKGIFECFEVRTFIVSIIPLLALAMRNDSSLGDVFKVTIIFYILSVIGGVVLQYWDCKNIKEKSFIDKLKNSAEATWYIPLMFTIFMLINFIIKQPFLIEIREITLLLTFFIQIPFLFGLVMYVIAFQNYCAFAAINC